MPYLISTAFSDFYSAINLPGVYRTEANQRRDWIVGRLRSHFEILEAHPTGSVPRYTALADKADIDVLVALHYGKHVEGKSPVGLLQSVRSALGPMAGSVRRNGQAVTMRFSTGLNADVVPASRLAEKDAFGNTQFNIPDSVRGEWILTVPARHTQRIALGVSTAEDQFKKTIKYAKHWNARLGVGLQGFHIENIALAAVTPSWRDDPSWATLMFFDKAREMLSSSTYMVDAPDWYLDWAGRTKAHAAAQSAHDLALSGWAATHGGRDDNRTAITSFKAIFGLKFPGYG